MTAAAPRPVALQSLGKLVTVGGHAVYIRRLKSAGLDLFRLTLVLEHDERAEADFAVVDGRVVLYFAQPAILRCYGGAERGRARLQQALQAAYRPAPVATVATSPEHQELEAARAAWKACRNIENARRFNRAWCRYHASIAR